MRRLLYIEMASVPIDAAAVLNEASSVPIEVAAVPNEAPSVH